MVSAVLPTPPSPSTTSLYKVILPAIVVQAQRAILGIGIKQRKRHPRFQANPSRTMEARWMGIDNDPRALEVELTLQTEYLTKLFARLRRNCALCGQIWNAGRWP